MGYIGLVIIPRGYGLHEEGEEKKFPGLWAVTGSEMGVRKESFLQRMACAIILSLKSAVLRGASS